MYVGERAEGVREEVGYRDNLHVEMKNREFHMIYLNNGKMHEKKFFRYFLITASIFILLVVSSKDKTR